MGLNILTKDFIVDLEQQEELLYNARVNALLELEEKSKAFFGADAPNEVNIQGTTFAQPTWITLGTDAKKIKEEASKYGDKTNHLVVGNGGSVEPAMAIFNSLVEPFGDAKVYPVNSPNPDESVIRAITEDGLFDKEDTIVYGVSKSGNTLNIVLQILGFMHAGYTVVPITQPTPSALKSIIDAKSLSFVVHTNVGGRFTANQPNALVPVYAAAIKNGVEKNVEVFITSLNEMAKTVRPDVPTEKNPAKQIALLLYRAELAGFMDIYMPIYSKRLMGTGGLITQIVHESYGKHGTGQTIVTMEGPECQHHSNQRFFGGPMSMVGMLVGVKNYSAELEAHTSEFADVDIKGIGKLGALDGLKFSELLKYERQGVYETAVEDGIPVLDIVLDKVDGDSVGKFTALMQGVVMYSAFLRGTRWDDQPSVEASKKKTIEMALSGKAPSYEEHIKKY